MFILFGSYKNTLIYFDKEGDEDFFTWNKEDKQIELCSIDILKNLYEKLRIENSIFNCDINNKSPLIYDVECQCTTDFNDNENYGVTFIMGYGINEEEAKENCIENLNLLENIFLNLNTND